MPVNKVSGGAHIGLPTNPGVGKNDVSTPKTSSPPPNAGQLNDLKSRPARPPVPPKPPHLRGNPLISSQSANRGTPWVQQMMSMAPAAVNTANAFGSMVQPAADAALGSLQTAQQIDLMQQQARDSMELTKAGAEINKEMTFTKMMADIGNKGMSNAESAAKGQ